MNGTYDCPNCGAPVPFQSSVAVFTVCPHCRSMVVRHDVKVEALGEMAQLPPDLSPLQLGVRGKFDGQDFLIIGRVRLAYDDGSWNEWCATFGDGRYGWIAEAQGFFMVSFECEPPENVDLKAGDQEVILSGAVYRVVDRKETVCLGAEGELPFPAPPGRKATSIDLTAVAGLFACAEYSDSGTRFFMGRYARFDDLNFFNLRAVPGWSDEVVEPTRNETTSLKCPNCGGTVVLRAAGLSMSATCGSCDSLIDTATPDLALIREAHGKQRITPLIPLGRRGQLNGVNYQVIGFQRVKDEYSGWTEYLLFNPWQGFVWLVTYNGHWSLVRRIFEQPEVRGAFLAGTKATYQDESYRMFAAGAVSTTYVLGEFYWKVRVGMAANVTDFISPPRILSREAYPNSGEETWSQGEYVESGIIQKAFGLEEPLPEPTGMYLNQPNPYAERGGQLPWLAILAGLILLLVQAFSMVRSADQPVFSADYQFSRGMTNPIAVTDPFEIKGGKQAVEFTLNANVDNNWLELDVDLVNAETHQVAASFTRGVEYYHGYDDGNWTEGSQIGHHLVSSLPGGKYYLTIDASADPAIDAMPFHVSVVRDVPVWSNFLVAFSLLLVYPIYNQARKHAFERTRWMESDYSPYTSSSSDDDDDDDS